MQIIDITFDLETCDVSPSAAPLQLAAIAWDRTTRKPISIDTPTDPFLRDKEDHELCIFNERVDLACAVMDGFTFNQDTIDFWARQEPEVQAVVVNGDRQKLSPQMLYESFFKWLTTMKEMFEADHLVLWCQGQDFDIPMMKYAAMKFGLKIPVNQYSYRDARTIAFEMAATNADRIDEVFSQPKTAPYEFLPPIPDNLMGYSHDAVFDCIRTAWSTWNFLMELSSFKSSFTLRQARQGNFEPIIKKVL